MHSTMDLARLGWYIGRAGQALRYVLLTGRDRDLTRPTPDTAWRRYAKGLLVGLAVAVLLLGELGKGYLRDHGDARVSIVVLLHVMPILLVRRRPLTAWRLAIAGTVLTLAVAAWLAHGSRADLGSPWTPAMLLYLPVVAMTIARCRRSDAGAVAAISFLLVVPAGVAVGTGLLSGAVGWGAAGVGAAALAGASLGRQARAEEQLGLMSRSAAEEQTRRAVLEERGRIVGELHDVIAHHLSLIAVRTETAPYRLAGLRSAPFDDPVRAEFAAVGDATRQALDETRQLLGVLRRDGDPDPDDDLAPQPGLDDIGALVAKARAAGVPATLTVHGCPPPASPTVGLVVYRVVQEALSNVRRHAAGAPVRVELRHSADQVRISVDNDPPTRPTRAAPMGSGRGLAGMRERIAIVRGDLTASPRPDGGFTVSAAVPVAIRPGGGAR